MPSSFIISTVLYLKSGTSKKVDWIEENLKKRKVDGNLITVEELTLDEANKYFTDKFLELVNEGSTVARKNVKGETSIIPFREVSYMTFTVKEVAKEQSVPPPLPPLPPKPEQRPISEHPAYKKPQGGQL